MNLMNISIKRLYTVIITIILVLLILILLLSLSIVNRRNLVLKSETFRSHALQLAQELENSSDELTMMARLYAVTGNPQFKNYYNTILAIRNGVIPRPIDYSSRYWDFILGGSKSENHDGQQISFTDLLKEINLEDQEISFLDLSHERSDELTALEFRAFNAVEGKVQDAKSNNTTAGKSDASLAIKLLHSKEYLQAKDKIMKPIGQFIDSIDHRTQAYILHLNQIQRLSLLMLVTLIFICFILEIMSFFILRRHLKQIKALLDHAAEIDLGNYNSRNDINSRNELGILGQTLNQMCESINHDIDKQQRLTDDLRRGEERFRLVVDNSPYGISITSLDGKFQQVNTALCKLLGYSKEELLNLGYKDISNPKDLLIIQRLDAELIKGEITSYSKDIMYTYRDGNTEWLNLTVALIRNHLNEPQNFVGQMINITDRIKSETAMLDLTDKMAQTVKELKKREQDETLLNKLNELLQLCMTIEEALPRIAVIGSDLFPDLSGGLSIYNKNTQLLENRLEWGNDKYLLPTFAIMDCFALRRGAPNVINDPNKDIPCIHYKTPPRGGYTGVPLIVLGEIIGVLHLFAPQGKVISLAEQQTINNFSNVIKLALSNIRLLESLHEQSIHDPLTGLFNRRYLDAMLSKELIRTFRYKSTLCVAMIDLDHFKKFNDTYGHEAGDVVLKYVAEVLEKTFRGSDLACRFGGEEFLLVLPDTDLSKAYERLDILRNEVKNAHIIYNNETLMQLTISIGLAIAPDNGKTAESIILAADQAMYSAKQAGRDRIEIYKNDSNTPSE